MKTKTNEDHAWVLALDPNTRFCVTSTSCDACDASKYAKYYSSIGYRVKTIKSEEELHKFFEHESRVRQQNMELSY